MYYCTSIIVATTQANTIDLFKGLKKIVFIGNLVDSPTARVVESFFDYEYLRDIRSQIRNGSKCSIRDLCRTNLCKNPRKSASLPCPFNHILLC
jgi:hypothetical protein